MLLDLLLNNFPQLRSQVLYVDIDQYLYKGENLELIDGWGTCLMKSHYPQTWSREDASEAMHRLLERAIIFRPVRGSSDVVKSLEDMTSAENACEFESQKKRFTEFWEGYEIHTVQFAELVDEGLSADFIHRVEELTGLVAGPFVPSPSRDKVCEILLKKIGTRILGPKAKCVNTTVRFGRS
ncbi:hypothetical protein AAFN60_16525 [Roseibacillus persicicus]|uniref:hypothetical protein n=1 Tax=Roseibacillus persicicus TaxID=454148 RepID=UPI00398ACF5A